MLLRTGYSLVGGPLFIPMKAVEWRMKAKMIDFLGLKIPGSEAVLLICFHILQPIEQAQSRDSSSLVVCN